MKCEKCRKDFEVLDMARYVHFRGITCESCNAEYKVSRNGLLIVWINYLVLITLSVIVLIEFGTSTLIAFGLFLVFYAAMFIIKHFIVKRFLSRVT